jgi:hypothetical protein
MAGGTTRSHRKKIHRESSRASVLNHSGSPAVLHSSVTEKCCLTTPSLLSRGTLLVAPVCVYRKVRSSISGVEDKECVVWATRRFRAKVKTKNDCCARNDTTTGRTCFPCGTHILRFSLDRVFTPHDTAIPDSGDVEALGGPGRECYRESAQATTPAGF